MARFAGDGVTLVGDLWGPEDGAGVILLHGGGQTRHSWTGAARRLAERGYRVVAYDARGHGDSEWVADGDYGIEAMSRDLLAVRATTAAPTAFVGASVGGLAAFFACGTTAPQPASALVMVDIALRPAQQGAERINAFMAAHEGGFADLDEAVAAVTAYNPLRSRPSEPTGLARNLREREDGRLYWHWDPRLLDESTAGSEALDQRYRKLVAVAPGVSVPTLLVRGRHSDVMTDENVSDMVRHVPQTELFEVPEAGHMIVGDRNDAFADGLISFLERHHPPR